MPGNVRFPGCRDLRRLPTMVTQRSIGTPLRFHPKAPEPGPGARREDMFRNSERSGWPGRAGKLLAGAALVIGPVVAVAVPAQAQVPTCLGLPATIIGTAGSDGIPGTPGDDGIIGRGGNDTICGDDGNDVIHGGDGNDVIQGGNGDDVIYGDNGADTIDGGAGNDN